MYLTFGVSEKISRASGQSGAGAVQLFGKDDLSAPCLGRPYLYSLIPLADNYSSFPTSLSAFSNTDYCTRHGSTLDLESGVRFLRL